jgi:hypothetical protein
MGFLRPACLLTVHVGGGSSSLSCRVFLPLLLLQAFLSMCCCSCLLACSRPVRLQLMWDVGLPCLLWSFPPSTTLTSFPAPGCWTHTTAPTLSGQAWLVYFQFQERFSSPPLPCSVRPTLFATCLYCSYCLLLSFSFFPGWGVSLSRGLC